MRPISWPYQTKGERYMKFRLKFSRMLAIMTMVVALAGTLLAPAVDAKTSDRQNEARFIQELGVSSQNMKKQKSYLELMQLL